MDNNVRCGPKVLGATIEIGGKGAAGIVGAKSVFVHFPRRGMLMCGKGAEGGVVWLCQIVAKAVRSGRCW